MIRKRLLFPEDIRESLKRRFQNQRRNWLSDRGDWPLVMPLGSPTERDVAEDVAGIRAWVTAWSGWHGAGEISWEDRHWPRLGSQRVPTGFSLASSEQVALVIGQQPQWNRACERYRRLIAEWPILAGDSVLPRYFDALADYEANDFERLCSLMSWLEGNPRSALYLRQLPVEGLDTKWVERRKSLVTELMRAVRGEFEERDLFAVCGLRRPPHRIRVRLLCPNLRTTIGGLLDFEAPVDEIAALPMSASVALIVENLESGLALPDLPGVVAFMKLGVAVGILDAIPWLRGIDAVYWGDIDTHGYAILERARRVLPGLKSALMDKETLLSHRNLWVEELVQNDAELPFLLDHERTVYEGLRSQTWGRNIRLEQERIPWASALKVLEMSLIGSREGR